MLQLLDGPCQGEFMCHRAPVFLRAVKKASGELDVLDLIEDTPKRGETVYVYQRVGPYQMIHFKMVKRSESGFYAMAKYKHMPEVQGAQLRNNTDWQRWASERLAEEQSSNNV